MRNIVLIVLTTLSVLFAASCFAQYKPGDAITPPDYPSLKNPAMKFGLVNKQGKRFAKDPTVVRFKGKYWMYFSFVPRDPEKKSYYYIGIATSDDLTNWTHVGDVTPDRIGSPLELREGSERPTGAVLGNRAAARTGNGATPPSSGLKDIAAPCAKVWDGKVHLFYQAWKEGTQNAIYYATSEDGLHFQNVFSTPIFAPKGDWTNGRAIDADFIEFKGKCYLYAATRDPAGKIQKQVVAIAEDRNNLAPDQWKQCDHCILEPTLPWETRCIEAASVCERDGKLFLFYGGGYNNNPQHIGLAQSDDGVNWTRVWNVPFITNGPKGQWNSSESGHPGVFIDPETDKTWLFFQGNDDNGKSWYLSRVELEWVDGLPKVK